MPTQTPVSSASASTSLPAPLQQLGRHSLNYVRESQQAQQLSAQGKDAQATALTKQAALEWLRYQASSKPALKAEINKLQSVGGAK